MTATLVLSIPVSAGAPEVFAGATDWDAQGIWMLGTRVRGPARHDNAVGAQVVAFTGIGPLGVTDTFEITVWEPPRRCLVLHTGRIVRGPAGFEVTEDGSGTAVFTWREDLELPFGFLGRLGWPLIRPVFAYGIRLSLKRFARWVEAGRPLPRAA